MLKETSLQNGQRPAQATANNIREERSQDQATTRPQDHVRRLVMTLSPLELHWQQMSVSRFPAHRSHGELRPAKTVHWLPLQQREACGLGKTAVPILY